MSLRTADYDYHLPDDLIARYPTKRRDESRMMLLERERGLVTHLPFRAFFELLRPEELVVFNNTEVVPARIRFPDRNAELLLFEQLDQFTWRCLVRPGKSFGLRRRFSIHGHRGETVQIEQEGIRVIRFDSPIDLDELGEIPLPPYLNRRPEAMDRERYQTVFATQKGAIAAPTAGLHFTPELMSRIPHEFITLHVGVGTFRPVKAADITQHQMHHEAFAVSRAAAARIEAAREVLAVGTTTVRTLETLMQRFGKIQPGNGVADIFIYPPFQFKRVQSLLTNFHLPQSTLLMLVAAFAGREFILEAYREAVRERYRFFSYGDCMLIR
ncbi:MAG: tRNA preQ1(34) S-adenosylmethionine ribosyltransferase-isomerase QueA [Verrucomicrobia bacterium]|nr:tRNA preQ1(34) S-adenosylmethionine ribosyltransferase-isomerase QueA [Verrucomicrobiota bacterium]